MEKYYILEWPESQKWIDMWHKDNSLDIRFLEDEAVAVECELYHKVESGNNKPAEEPLKKFLARFTLVMDYDIEVEAKDKDSAEAIASSQLPSIESGEWCNGGAECWCVDEVNE